MWPSRTELQGEPRSELLNAVLQDMLLAIQDINGLLPDMMGVIAMEGYHAGSVREALIVEAHTQTRYGMPVYQLTAVRDWVSGMHTRSPAWSLRLKASSSLQRALIAQLFRG